jgi:hypothetical protein
MVRGMPDCTEGESDREAEARLPKPWFIDDVRDSEAERNDVNAVT